MSRVDVLAAAHENRAAYLRANCRASARKSCGSFKPVIVTNPGPWQRTEVVGMRCETCYRVWADGRPDPRTAYVHHERGITYPTRAEAIARAEAEIEGRARDAMRAAEKALARVTGGVA